MCSSDLHGAAVCGALAIRLVDPQRWDRHASRRLREEHAELAKIGVGAAARSRDGGDTLHKTARLSCEDSLREKVADRVLSRVEAVGGYVVQLLAAGEEKLGGAR